MVQAEFSSVNCLLLPLSPVNCPCHLRNQSFFSREGDVHVHAPHNYGRSLKWRKTINEMGGNIPGGNFLGGNFLGGIFQGGVCWLGIFLVGILPGGIFLEPLKTLLSFYQKQIYAWQIVRIFEASRTPIKSFETVNITKTIQTVSTNFWI